jgi:glycosyltransferase involved in cell wall biosynthesis
MFERTIEGAACVAVLNRGAVAEMRRAWHREASLLPAPVDVRAFRPCAPKDLASPKVLFTADLSDPRKGGILLLRAWNFVHQRCPQAILVLAGPHGHAVGARRVDLLSAIPSLVDVPARKQIEIRGPGSLEELPGLYSQSAVTVLPSIDEPFGMVLTESLACGTPVVCSQEGGPGEIVTEPEVGTTVPLSTQQDLYSMTRAMQLADAMLEGIELAGRPGTSEHCRAHAQQWSLDVIGRATETMYEDVVSQARQRSRRRTHSRTPRPKPISV